MNVTYEEACQLFKHESSGVPSGDVLRTRYNQWDMGYNISIKNNKISIQNNGSEAIFMFPAVKVLEAHINEPTGTHHSIRVLKQVLPRWDGNSPCLPYPTNADFFPKIESVVTDCLRKAFDEPDLFEEATNEAWQCVNMEAANPEELAFEIFLNKANLPYSDLEWKIKRNTMRNKSQKIYIPIVDIANVEHTMKYTIDKDAIVSVAVRLWPYHFSANSYGVAASFADAGIKVWHKGGTILARRRWMPYHYHLVVTIDRSGKHVYTIYDICGNVFKIKTPVITIQTVSTNGFTIELPEKDTQWCDSIKCLYQQISTNLDNVCTLENTLFVYANRHSLAIGDRVILTLSVLPTPNIRFHMLDCFKV